MVKSAAPQLIIISRPSGSATGSRRSTSACRLIRGPPSAANRHGWVLWTEGAQTALDTTYLTISSVVIGSFMPLAHGGPPGAGRCQGQYPAGPLAARIRMVSPRPMCQLRAARAQASAVQHDRRDADEVVSFSRGPRPEAKRPQPGQLARIGHLTGRPDGGDAPAGLVGQVHLIRLERDHGAAGGGGELAAAVGPDNDVSLVLGEVDQFHRGQRPPGVDD